MGEGFGPPSPRLWRIFDWLMGIGEAGKGKAMKHSSQKSNSRDKAKQGQKDVSKVSFGNIELANELDKINWGKDILSENLEAAFYNIGVSFLKLGPYCDCLTKAFATFDYAIKLLSYSDFKGLASVSLFARAYSCFFGAVRLSCSGQITDTWVLLRACIENSLYAFYIADNSENAMVWAERHNSESHKKNCRNVFAIGNVWKALGEKSQSLTKEVKEYYEDTIDWGAHPNERSIFINLEVKQDDSGYNLNVFNPDEVLMRHSLCAVIMTISLVLDVFGLTYPDEFKQPNLTVKIDNLNRQRSTLFRAAREYSKAVDEVAKRKAR